MYARVLCEQIQNQKQNEQNEAFAHKMSLKPQKYDALQPQMFRGHGALQCTHNCVFISGYCHFSFKFIYVSLMVVVVLLCLFNYIIIFLMKHIKALLSFATFSFRAFSFPFHQ